MLGSADSGDDATQMECRTMRFALAMLLALVLATTASAVPGMAKGPVILTVGSAEFDRDALERLPQAGFDTTTPWTKGVNRFEARCCATCWPPPAPGARS
jgi:hypothetical protein